MAMAKTSLPSDSTGAEIDYISPPGMNQDNIYDEPEHPGRTSNKSSPETARPGSIVTRIILVVLTVSHLLLGAILVWQVVGLRDGSRTEFSALADAIVNMTISNQDQANKLEVMNEKIANLTAASQAQVKNVDDSVELINRKLVLDDCQELRDYGSSLSGVYSIDLYNMSRHLVYCDMTTNGGGWTVLLRRKDGSVQFNQTWEAYKHGFGDLSGEFWAGNELMFQMTSRPRKSYRLRVELGSYDNQSAYAEYDVFRVDSEREFYRLHVSGYTGAAGDSLTFSDNLPFTTQDEDHDTHIDYNCAVQYQGGWWYQACCRACLTGQYGTQPQTTNGIIWRRWQEWINLKSAVMMVRPG